MSAPAVRTRFAPSPTGLLHLGNARVALINWLFARHAGGRLLLRLDDTDRARSTAEAADAIARDLRWLGLDWDETARQSERFERYDRAAEALKAAGRLYPCYETPEELTLKRKRADAAGRPPVYDRAALALDADARAELEAQGRRPHWRFRLEDRETAFDDGVHGRIALAAGSASDPVLIREDGSYLYMLPSVVDDLELGVTHVLRGDDHISNTAVQIQLFQALAEPDRPAPDFAHFPLLVDAAGAPLSKRSGSLSLADLRDRDGYEAIAVTALLARLGTSDAVAPARDLAELIDGFALAKFGRAAPRFERSELDRLNAAVIHALPFAEAARRVPDLDPAFWDAVRPNLTRLADVETWRPIVDGPVTPRIDDPDFARTAAGLLPPEPWGEGTWRAWTEAVKAATGAKGKALFMPLRLALTGRDHGPELTALLPLIGRDKAAARLQGRAA